MVVIRLVVDSHMYDMYDMYDIDHQPHQPHSNEVDIKG